MVPIGLASIVGLAAFLERVIALRRARVIPRHFAVEVESLLEQRRWGDIGTLCKKEHTAAGRLVATALAFRGAPRGAIKERLEEVGRREGAELERTSQVLGTVASVSPLLGLLGTVWGMILTFEVIEQQGVGVISSLAGGISQALITTLAGLSVGIPALVAYKWVIARADAFVLELEELALLVLEHLSGTEDPEEPGA
jgi:biopolymer transport protein ExbB